ncbi:MAG: hypothetical protein WEB57_12835 [Pseudohongiellaceae bacterium]
MLLQRLTTEYIPVEDRIRLSGEADSGETVRLWLTQRLLLRLLPLLFRWLDKHPGTAGEATSGLNDTTESSSNDPARKEALQHFAQQGAQDSLESSPPVRAEQATLEWLIHEVDIASGNNGVRLVFRPPEETSGETITLVLETRALRQWLVILYRHFSTAGWPLNVWPRWLQAAAQEQSKQSGAVLH